jgi:hypothetical protein
MRAAMGNVEVKILGVAALADDPESAAMRWLMRFIEAESLDLPDLFAVKPGSGFAEFIFAGRKSGIEAGVFPPSTPAKLKEWKSLHAELRQALRVVLEGHGKQAYPIKFESDDGLWLLLYRRGHDKSPDGLRSEFRGALRLAVLGRVNSLLGRFGERVKLCPACSKIFLAEHGNQSYDIRECSDRHRQERFWRKKLAAKKSAAGRSGRTSTRPAIDALD